MSDPKVGENCACVLRASDAIQLVGHIGAVTA